VFADRTSEFQKIDLDVGEALGADDHAPTNKQAITTEMELSELEPVTMSEVGTKLDLARAYMDMGDPDGARSILEEVLQEGTSNQKQEAQRLLDSIR
jgi:pilus assembly protein FimV